MNNLRNIHSYLEEGEITEIDDWDECYITTDGRIFRIKELTPYDTGNGYLYIKVMIAGKTVGDYIHRLVAKAWHPNPNNLETVDHIDGDKSNNHLSNLRWFSLADNIRAYFGKDYAIMSPEGQLYHFSNINLFARDFGLDNSALAKVLKGKMSNTKGWTAPKVGVA